MASFLIAPHTLIYDLPLLLVVLPVLPMTSSTTWIRYALLTPLPYWGFLRGMPWSLALPLMLLGALLCVCFTRDRAPRVAPGSARSVYNPA
jgi:hypothetical protein